VARAWSSGLAGRLVERRGAWSSGQVFPVEKIERRLAGLGGPWWRLGKSVRPRCSRSGRSADGLAAKSSGPWRRDLEAAKRAGLKRAQRADAKRSRL